MSPNEFQLRAALREGEGEPLDAGDVIAKAHAARHDRVVRLTSIAAAVVVVAAVGVVGGLALRPDSHSHGTAAQPASPSGSATHPAPGPLRQGAGGAPMIPAVTCPASFPQQVPNVSIPPNGQAPTNATAPLFSGPVEAITICAYRGVTVHQPAAGPNGKQISLTLTGSKATDLATSLNNASTQHQSKPCPTYVIANAYPVAIIGVSKSGKTMTPVTTTLLQNPCNQIVTNGSAVRYNWSPPPNLLAPLLAQLRSSSGSTTGTGAPTGTLPGGGLPMPGSGSGAPGSIVRTPPRASGSPAR